MEGSVCDTGARPQGRCHQTHGMGLTDTTIDQGMGLTDTTIDQGMGLTDTTIDHSG
jgi:hypothetical protein